MARDGVGEQEVFFLRSGADIMNDQRRAFLRFPVGNDANVGNTIGQVPCNQVAGLVVRRVFRNGNGPTFSGKKGTKIRDPAVVNAAVRRFQSPYFRVFGKVGLHVLMHGFLKVQAEGSHSADDHIRAYSRFAGNVSVGVGNGLIASVVGNRYSYLFTRPGRQCGVVRHQACRAGKKQEDEKGRRFHRAGGEGRDGKSDGKIQR